jgi:hypothetical protein
VVVACAPSNAGVISEIYPNPIEISGDIPEPARTYLSQAHDSLHTPAGAVMLCASAIDAMLKKLDYKDGTLYERINKAEKEHRITKEMAEWAHDVRLDANDQRHADLSAPLPTQYDAARCIAFADTLGLFLFVLPAMVTRGRTGGTTAATETSA